MRSSFILPNFFESNSPEVPVTTHYPQFLAQVTCSKYDKDRSKNTDQAGKLLSKQVAFNICGLPEFTGTYPVANPMFDHVREMKVDDLILVRDMGQGCVHSFFYIPYREDDFVGLWNQSNVVSVSEDKKIKILMFPDGTKVQKPENAEKVDGAIGSIVMESDKSNNVTVTIKTKKFSIVGKDNGQSVALTVGDTSATFNNTSATIKADTITLDGELTVTKAATFNDAVTVTKEATFNDAVTVTKEVTGKGIALSTHTHTFSDHVADSDPVENVTNPPQ